MMTKQIIVISDIHGCFKELKQLIEEKLPSNKKNYEFVFLGDYIDRGRNSKKTIEYLMELNKKYKCVFLKGNHEDMFLDFLKNPKMDHIFLYNGGYNTLANYKNEESNKSGYEVSDKHINFIKNMKLWHETDDYFFVHAGVPNKDLDKITLKDESTLLWIRDEFLNSEYIWEKIIVHGHTPTDNFLVEFKDNRINIDTGCIFGGNLSYLQLPENIVNYVAKLK